MSWYYRSIGKNKTVHWSNRGRYDCPERMQLEKDSGNMFFRSPDHVREPVLTGQVHQEVEKIKDEINADGDREVIKKTTYKKVRKGRNDLFCYCGKTLVFRGYPVYVEKVLKKGTTTNIRGLGAMVFGQETKRQPTRYFKSTKSQKEFINKASA